MCSYIIYWESTWDYEWCRRLSEKATSFQWFRFQFLKACQNKWRFCLQADCCRFSLSGFSLVVGLGYSTGLHLSGSILFFVWFGSMYNNLWVMDHGLFYWMVCSYLIVSKVVSFYKKERYSIFKCFIFVYCVRSFKKLYIYSTRAVGGVVQLWNSCHAKWRIGFDTSIWVGVLWLDNVCCHLSKSLSLRHVSISASLFGVTNCKPYKLHALRFHQQHFSFRFN